MGIVSGGSGGGGGVANPMTSDLNAGNHSITNVATLNSNQLTVLSPPGSSFLAETTVSDGAQVTVGNLLGDWITTDPANSGTVRLFGARLGVFGHAAAAKPTVAGAKLPSDVVLASLLTGLEGLGLITDSST